MQMALGISEKKSCIRLLQSSRWWICMYMVLVPAWYTCSWTLFPCLSWVVWWIICLCPATAKNIMLLCSRLDSQPPWIDYIRRILTLIYICSVTFNLLMQVPQHQVKILDHPNFQVTFWSSYARPLIFIFAVYLRSFLLLLLGWIWQSMGLWFTSWNC